MHSFREVNVSSVIARLYGWVYKTLRLSPLVVEHSVVVMSARLNPIGSQFVQNQWSMIFWESIKDSDTGGLSSIPIRMEYLLAFKYWYCELCVENRWGRSRKHYFFFFFFFFCAAWIVNEWGVVESDRKSYLGAAEIASFSCRDFSPSSKYDTFWHVVTTGYFYILFL